MIAQKLASYTGLSETCIERTNLRVNTHRFCKDLLREQGVTVGRLDSRYTGFGRDPAGETHKIDPGYAVMLGP